MSNMEPSWDSDDKVCHVEAVSSLLNHGLVLVQTETASFGRNGFQVFGSDQTGKSESPGQMRFE